MDARSCEWTSVLPCVSSSLASRVCVSHDDQRPRMSLTDAETQSHDHYSCCRRRSHFLDGTPGGEKGKEMVRRRSVGGERAKQPVLRVTRMQKGTRECVCVLGSACTGACIRSVMQSGKKDRRCLLSVCVCDPSLVCLPFCETRAGNSHPSTASVSNCSYHRYAFLFSLSLSPSCHSTYTHPGPCLPALMVCLPICLSSSRSGKHLLLRLPLFAFFVSCS